MVDLCTRLATERARTVTLHLQAGAREVYPNKPATRHCSTRPNQDLKQNPRTILESMPEKPFMVYLNGAEDPMDLAYHQPVRASRVEVSEDCLGFFTADGTLAVFFESPLFTVGVK